MDLLPDGINPETGIDICIAGPIQKTQPKKNEQLGSTHRISPGTLSINAILKQSTNFPTNHWPKIKK